MILAWASPFNIGIQMKRKEPTKLFMMISTLNISAW